ncbi:MAG: flagellar biosynthesis anti-sigma factor FlgM [Pirellulales bacterium]
MQIYGPSAVHAAQSINAPHYNRAPAGVGASGGGIDISDTLEISSEGMFAEKLQSLPDIRADRVASLRAEIADGSYETDDKLDMALERMLDELA